MLASAVALPDDPPSNPTSPPARKRRQSSTSSNQSKRPRLDVPSNQNDGSPPSATSPVPGRRKSTADDIEERKRNRRLFGALLGTLSQTASKPAHRRRDEIEKRQQEKIRQKDEEAAEEKRLKREALDRLRREEQKIWDQESMQVRHASMRACARFLRTKTEPRLYYKPWDLRPEEEITIKRQIVEAEQTITREVAEHAAKTSAETGMDQEMHSPVATVGEREGRVDGNPAPIREPDGPADTDQQPEGDGIPRHDETERDAPNSQSHNHAPSKSPSLEPAKVKERGGGHDYDHGQGELVEGQEDDVIY